MSRNSQIFLNKRNCPNCAATPVSRLSEKDNSSLHLLLKKDPMKWRIYVSRVHFTSKWGNIPRERVVSWKHKNRPSPGCESLLSSRTLQCGDHYRIFISRPNSFLGSHRERKQQVRDRNVRRNSCCRRWEQRYREICREGQTTTRADSYIVSCVYSLSWTKLDRRWTRNIPSSLFWSVKIYDQMATTWYSSSRRYGAVRFDDMIEKCKVKLLEPYLFQTFPVFPSNPGTFRRYSRWSYFATQCTVAGWLRRVHLPHRERSWHALRHPRWIDSGRKNSQKGLAVSVFHSREPDVRQSRSRRSLIRSGQSQNYGAQKYLESPSKTQYAGAIWSSLKEKDCSSIKHDHMQSLFSTHYLRFIEKWCTWRLERNCTARYINLQGYHVSTNAEFATWTSDPPGLDARKSTDHQSEQRLYRGTCRSFLQDTRREYPGESQGCLYKETCRCNVDYGIPGFPHSTVQQVDTNRKETD